MEKQFEKFNQKESLMVISSYPPLGGEAAKQNAVACYCQNLLKAYKGKRIIVLAEIVNGFEKPYVDGNILVYPCWRYQSPKLYWDLVAAMLRFDQPRKVLVQFEFNMLGSFVHSALMPFLLMFIGLMGKSVTVMLHQVVDDLAKLAGHLNLKRGLKRFILNCGLHLFYFLTGLFADSIIVHEQFLKDILCRWVNKEKIKVISHGLYLDNSRANQAEIRKRMNLKRNDFVILMFGYITWYKGTDWIIEKVKKLTKEKPELNIKVIVAGGQSATLKNKPHYKKFLKRVKRISQNKNIIMTGFVPDNEVADYFKISDLVVLPYRAMMSASGPLSFALMFNKPFIVSEVLANAFKNPDAKQVMEDKDFQTNDFVFSLKGKDFEEKIVRIVQDKSSLNFLSLFTNKLRALRSWDNIVCQYNLVIGKTTQKHAPVKVGGAFIPKLTRSLKSFIA